MQYSIKQLRRIETEITDIIETLKNRIGTYDDTYTNIAVAKQAFKTKSNSQFIKLEKYLEAKFTIRGIISKANSELGIDKHTAEIAKLESLKKVLEQISEVRCPRIVPNYTTGNNSIIEYYSGNSEEYVDEIAVQQRKLTREVQVLKDRCAGTNAQTQVSIPEELRIFLQMEELI